MNTYEDEIYKFVATKENFKSAIEISNLLPEIKGRLITDFWDLVKNEIEDYINKNGKNWVLSMKKDGHLYIDINNQKDLRIYFAGRYGKCYYGIGSNNYKNGLLDEKRVEKYINEEALYKEMKKTSWSVCWIEFNQENFTNIQTLIKILPEERDVFKDEIVNHILNFTIENEIHIEQFCKMRK